MTDAPKMVHSEDLANTLAQGSDILASMISTSVDDGEMPPADLFKWYVEYVVLRFVLEEYQMLYQTEDKNLAESHMHVQVIAAAIRKLLQRIRANKQFGLEASVNDRLRQRKLHLPTGYVDQLAADDLPQPA